MVLLQRTNTYKENMSKMKKKNRRRNEDPKFLRAWEKGEKPHKDNDEMENSCFVSLAETGEIRSYNCQNCNYL